MANKGVGMAQNRFVPADFSAAVGMAASTRVSRMTVYRSTHWSDGGCEARSRLSGFEDCDVASPRFREHQALMRLAGRRNPEL